MAYAPSFDGYALDSTNGIAMAEWEDEGAVRLKFEENLASGRSIRESYLSGRDLQVDLHLKGSTAANLNSLLGALLTKLQRNDAAWLKVTSDRQIRAFCKPGPIKIAPGSSGLVAKLRVEFMTEDAFWIGTALNTDDVVNTSSTVSFAATNAGTAPALPDFEIENTGATDYTGITVTIENTTISKQLRALQMDLDAGDKLIIKANGEVYIEAPAGATSKTPKRLDGTHPYLAAGANTLQFSHAFGSGSDITFRANWYDTYHVFGEI